jgi:uncharacterized protein YndB with AHSA1/START domain
MPRHARRRYCFRRKDWGLGGYAGENGGLVLVACRPERVGFRWKADSDGNETTADITFEPRADGILASLLESEYEDSAVGEAVFP